MLSTLFVINILLALVIIFLERRDPASTLAWIMVLFLVPGVGILLYMAFAQNIARQKIFKLYDNEEALMKTSSGNQSEAITLGEFQFDNKAGEKWKNLILLNQVHGMSFYTQNNEIEIFTDGHNKMNSLFTDIENATECINIEYFIIKRDILGDALLRKLIEKAKEGVKVRLLVDALGSWNINKHLVEKLQKAGGLYAEFFPTKWKVLNTKINYRNHRKLVIIDNCIGYIGGYNMAREYIGRKKKFGNWRDTHMRIKGDSVFDLNTRFLLDWRSASEEEVSVEEVFFTPETNEGNVGIQIVSSGPDTVNEEIKRGFLKMITTAKKNIYIQTPYFVPDEPILEVLKMAIQTGVDVRVMIPSIQDHLFVYWATYSYVSEIIDAGGKVYIYDDGFLHAKTMMVDGEVSTVGSANFDRRSFRLNFEANAFIYDEDETKKLEAIFEDDIRKSHLLTKELYEQRGIWIRIKEAVSRILSDIL